MKTNFLAKHKWYIVGFILIAVMLSVSLSFSAWDTLSAKAIMNAKGGDFIEKPPAPVWSDYIKDGTPGKEGQTLTSIPKVGATVQYGEFYQKSRAITTEPQKWIVVDYNATTKVATLLTEQVISCGNYWGNASSSSHAQKYLNDYYRSTVRSWLNSGKSNVRDDSVGSKFSGSAPLQVNKGFLDVAFTGGAETILVPKKITGMKYAKQPNSTNVYCGTNPTEPSSINDLVWIPSHKEIFGSDFSNVQNVQMDDPSDTRFTYFQNGGTAAAPLTAYAKGSNANYYENGSGGSSNWYWLRSPNPSNYKYSLDVDTDGSGNRAGTYYSDGGVRPAVCVQL